MHGGSRRGRGKGKQQCEAEHARIVHSSFLMAGI
jgi:hypothetical protein